jgi:hypothetical protein
MRPFGTADVAFLETLKARQETLKAEFTAAERAQDAQHAAKIAAELQEMADKASAELLRFADRLATLTEARSRPWWRRLVGWETVRAAEKARQCQSLRRPLPSRPSRHSGLAIERHSVVPGETPGKLPSMNFTPPGVLARVQQSPAPGRGRFR